MGRGYKGSVTVQIRSEEYDDTGAGVGGEPKRLKHDVDYTWNWTSGTTDGTMMDRVYSAAPSLTTTPTDIDLISASSLASAMDGSLNVAITDLCMVCVLNTAANGSGDADIGAGSAPYDGMWLAAGDGASVKPQGILLWIAPYGAVATATTADILRAVASAGTVPVKVLLAGRST